MRFVIVRGGSALLFAITFQSACGQKLINESDQIKISNIGNPNFLELKSSTLQGVYLDDRQISLDPFLTSKLTAEETLQDMMSWFKGFYRYLILLTLDTSAALPSLVVDPVQTEDVEASIERTKPSAHSIQAKYEKWQQQYESV